MTESDPFQPTSTRLPDSVRLHHGTTLSAARSIAEVGLVSIPIRESVQRIAQEFDVEIALLTETARQLHALTITQEMRADWSCFAPTEAAAWRWASRAPETRWELLRAVWAIRGHDPWSDEFVGWRRLQYQNLHPAVVIVDVPTTLVRGQGGRPAVHLFTDRHENTPELWVASPVSPSLVAGLLPGPRRVYLPELSALVGQEVLEAMIKSGELPAPERDGWPNGQWYPWEVLEVAQLMPSG